MFKKILIFSLLSLGNANEEEKELSNYLFENYDKTTRPIKNYDEPVIVEMGLGVQTLESFNQKEESLALNIWVRSNWNDNNLAWGNYSNLTFLSVNTDDIWTPDIELYNSGDYPEIWTRNSEATLDYEGNVFLSIPVLLTFSCFLELENFPFDTQTCSMEFGSWKFSKKYLDIRVIDDTPISYENFYHNEWIYPNFINFYVIK